MGTMNTVWRLAMGMTGILGGGLLVGCAGRATSPVALHAPGNTATAGWSVAKDTSSGDVVFAYARPAATALPIAKLRVLPQLDAGEPELLEWTVNAELNLGLLHYFAGWVGTLDKYAVTRVAVIDLATGKLLGCPPRSYTPAKGAPKVRQPVYRVEAGRLVVEDVEWGGREIFPAASRPEATAR